MQDLVLLAQEARAGTTTTVTDCPGKSTIRSARGEACPDRTDARLARLASDHLAGLRRGQRRHRAVPARRATGTAGTTGSRGTSGNAGSTGGAGSTGAAGFTGGAGFGFDGGFAGFGFDGGLVGTAGTSGSTCATACTKADACCHRDQRGVGRRPELHIQDGLRQRRRELGADRDRLQRRGLSSPRSSAPVSPPRVSEAQRDGRPGRPSQRLGRGFESPRSSARLVRRRKPRMSRHVVAALRALAVGAGRPGGHDAGLWRCRRRLARRRVQQVLRQAGGVQPRAEQLRP